MEEFAVRVTNGIDCFDGQKTVVYRENKDSIRGGERVREGNEKGSSSFLYGPRLGTPTATLPSSTNAEAPFALLTHLSWLFALLETPEPDPLLFYFEK